MAFKKKPKTQDHSGSNLIQFSFALGRITGILSVFPTDGAEIEWLRARGVSDETLATMRLNLDVLADSLDGRNQGPLGRIPDDRTVEVASWSELIDTVFAKPNGK